MKHEIRTYTWLHWIIPPALLSIITALVYRLSFHYEFQFDDIANITKHFDIRHNSLKMLWFTGTRWISYWLNSVHYSIGKFDPYSYRVGNTIIHSANGILIFFFLFTVLTRLKKESFYKKHAFVLACLTAALFLLHPVQTQTVSYVIQGELEGLSALAILSMSLCYTYFATAQKTVAKIISGILLFGLAILSCGTKEIAIISPALLLLVDWFFVAQGNIKSLKKRIPILGALTICIVGFYLYLLKPAFFAAMFEMKKNNIGNVITDSPDILITPWAFFISQFKVILHYLWIFIWPFNISVEYDWVLARNFFAQDCIFPLMGLLVIAYYIYKILRKNPANTLGFGALWFAFCLAPRTSFIPSPELLVDYKTYLASFGWLFILAMALVFITEKIVAVLKSKKSEHNSPYAHAAVGCSLVAALSFATIQRNTVWSSGLEFWDNVIQNAPGKARAYNNYAVELALKLNKFAESVPYFKKAIAMDAKYPDPCNNLAVAYSQLDRIDDAIDALKLGLNINPYYPEGYNNLASFFLKKKNYAQAKTCLDMAIKLRPYYGKAHFNLGRLYLEENNHEKAWECFKTCCTQADFDVDTGFATYAKMSLNLKKYDDAIFGYKKTLELNPNYPDAAFNLANSYFLAERIHEAISVFEQMLTRNPHETKVIYNLGEAYLKLNETEKALACFKKIETHIEQVPQLHIRMAACYARLGKFGAAQQLLIATANDTKLPENIRQAAVQYLKETPKA